MNRRALTVDPDEDHYSIKGSREVSPVIDVQHAPTLAALETIVSEAGGIEHVLFSDLGLGAWRPHQIAAEWAECLGMTPYPPSWGDSHRPVRAQLSFGAIADAGIEMEALGERVVRDASVLARRLVARLWKAEAHRLLAVVAPAAGGAWREENLVFLRFMLGALDGTSCRLRVLACFGGQEEFNAPQGMLPQWRPSLVPAGDAAGGPQTGIECIPGVIPQSLVRSFECGAGLSLRHGGLLLAPERRPAGLAASTLYDRMRPLLSDHPWLDAYAQVAGSNFHVDVGQLARYATSAFDLGGAEIAMDYLVRAISCASGVQRAALECQLQGYRIATHRFSDAACAGEASPNLPPKLRAFLCMARGWGAVMSGQPEKGIADLKRSAAQLEGDSDGRFRAYLQNITALGLAQLGSLDEAMTLEEAVQGRNSGPRRSWPLYYVNQINTARLYRRKGDHQTARRYYEDAFASHWGGRSTSDRVYANAVMARLAEGAGEASVFHWVRCALHFAAAEMPESIGVRHASLILGKQSLSASREQRVEDVAEALASKIEAALSDNAMDSPISLVPVFTERAPDQDRALQAVLVGAPGWSLIGDSHPIAPVFEGVSMRRLRRALGCWVASQSTYDVKWVRTYYVDSRFGREIAVSPAEALETALRLKLGSVSFQDFDLCLDVKLRNELDRQSRLQISSLVSEIGRGQNGLDIKFKRCRQPVQLSDETGIVAAAERGGCVGDVLVCQPAGVSWAHIFAEIACLEEAGVLWRKISAEEAARLTALNGSIQ